LPADLLAAGVSRSGARHGGRFCGGQRAGQARAGAGRHPDAGARRLSPAARRSDQPAHHRLGGFVAMNLLPYAIYLSFLGALLALLAGRRSAAAARCVALVSSLAAWACVLVAAVNFTPTAGLQTLVNVPWIPGFGIHYHLAADGISLTLLVLTGLASTAGILFSWNITERRGEFFAYYLTLIAGVYGVFLSADAFLLFVFYEIAIVPKYFLIANWGSTNRDYGAMKLVLYSFAGSALVLAGLLWTYAVGDAEGFAISELVSAAVTIPHGQQLAIFALIFFGFATLAGLFPLHTWAPT